MDEIVSVLGFSLSGTTPSILDSLLDAKEMGAKTVFLQVFPIKIVRPIQRLLVLATQPTFLHPTYIRPTSYALLYRFDLCLLLEINRKSKEKIFNSYWENKKLNGYRRQNIVRKS